MDIKNISDKYCLHDCIIDKIEIKKSSLILYSHEGVYKLNDKTKEYEKIKNCKIIIEIKDLVEEECHEHISIDIFKKNLKRNISFNKFCDLVAKNKYKIYLDFYSPFARGLLFKGCSKKCEVELLITEVIDFQIDFLYLKEE